MGYGRRLLPVAFDSLGEVFIHSLSHTFIPVQEMLISVLCGKWQTI